MLDWIKARWLIVRSTIAAGNVRQVERRYFPAAVFVGLFAGVFLSLLSDLTAVLVILVGGYAMGYATRAYVSYRRRAEVMRRRGEMI